MLNNVSAYLNTILGGKTQYLVAIAFIVWAFFGMHYNLITQNEAVLIINANLVVLGVTNQVGSVSKKLDEYNASITSKLG